MIRRYVLRTGLLACLIGPLLTMFVVGVQAQSGKPTRSERSWSCPRCGTYLGTGETRPTYCPRCDADDDDDFLDPTRPTSSGRKAGKKAGDRKGGPSAGTVIIVAL